MKGTIGKKIIWLVIGLILLELLLRISGFVYLTIQEHKNQLSEGNAEDVYCILCLGESTTAEGGASSWPAQLEKVLNERASGKNFRVINGGILSANTAFILLGLKDNLEKYKPQMVITMMGANDRTVTAQIIHENELQTKDTPLFGHLRIYKLSKLILEAIKKKDKEIQINTEKNAIPAESEQISQQQKVEETETYFQKVIQENPNSDYAYSKLGEVYFHSHMFEEAEKMFKKAIEKNPNNKEAYDGLGWMYTSTSRFEEAEKMFKKAIELDSNIQNPYMGLGLCYQNQGRLNEAKWMYEKAISLNPNKVIVLTSIGDFYYNHNMFEEAVELYKKALKINPNDSRVYNKLSVYYQHLNISDEEIERFYKERGFAFKLQEDMTHQDVTRYHYHQLYGTLNNQGIKLIVMQYPTRDINELKSMFKGDEDITFVSNEENFKQALKNGKYEDYFIDKCYITFGHATSKGNQLIAENIANTILKEIDANS